MRVMVGLVLIGLAGCSPEPVEQTELVMTFGWQPTSGFDPVSISSSRLYTREIDAQTGEILSEAQQDLDDEAVQVVAFDATGDEIRMEPHPRYPRLRFPERPLTPGTWQLRAQAGDASIQTDDTAPISDHGQLESADGFDADSLDGATFALDIADGHTVGIWAGINADLLDTLVVHLEREDGSWNAQVFAPAAEPDRLCRAWAGPVAIDEAGELSATAASITVSEGLAARIYNADFRVRFDADAETVAGGHLEAELDTRDLDPLLDDEEGPAEPGDAGALMAALGVDPHACPDGEAFCIDYLVAGIDGERDPSEATRDQMAAAELCRGAQPGAAGGACSVIGSLGIGAWVFGVFAVLGRRRRI